MQPAVAERHVQVRLKHPELDAGLRTRLNASARSRGIKTAEAKSARYGVVTKRKKREGAAAAGTEMLKLPLLRMGVSGLLCQSTGGSRLAVSSRTNPPADSDQLRPKVRLLAGLLTKPGRNGDELPP
jgi:hypothetical protein